MPRGAAKRGGRPRSFDRAEALRRAMMLFWRHGYEATSLADLTAAMGIRPPSLYAAFGDKKRLFLEAVDAYLASGIRLVDQRAMVGASAREWAAALLRNSAVVMTGADTPPGCLVAAGATNCTAEDADLPAALAAIRRGFEADLRARIEADVARGTLPPATDAATLAAFTTTVVQGMSNQARDGAPRERLLAVAEWALRAWPGESPAPERLPSGGSDRTMAASDPSPRVGRPTRGDRGPPD